ncbi:MAG: hypothetical protein N2V77_07690 [Canidatus Methanoxibalbensis ujae]|nr:hypothetical protein [Candidatus Methanoxibalbensis ujae]
MKQIMESFLERECADFQKDLRGGDAELYSATKQQAAVKKTVKKNQKAEQWKTENPLIENSLILRDDVYDGDRQQAIGIQTHGRRDLPVK